MYEQDGLQDHYYMILYGAATMFAALAGLYLLLRHRNALSDAEPPLALRRWTAAFFAAVALSHVWWTIIGTIVLNDNQFLRNAINIMLDSVTLVPLMMTVLLKMLQDRRRPLWPVPAAILPAAAVTIYLGIIERNPRKAIRRMAARQLCRPETQGSMAEHATDGYHTADVLRLQDKLRRLLV